MMFHPGYEYDVRKCCVQHEIAIHGVSAISQ